MPYEWKVDQPTCTVVVRGYGEGVTADTLQLVEDLKDQLKSCEGYDFLYNSVEMRIQSNPTDMMKVAQAMFGEAGLRFRRFAIVVPPARMPLARIFAALAHPFGISANVFPDDESAREWLAGHPEAQRNQPDAAGSAGGESPRPQ